MYYIKEIYIRIKYLTFAFTFLFFSLYFNYNNIFKIIDFYFKNLLNYSQLTENHYIYTHILELYYVQLYFSLSFSFIFILPIIAWQLLDFLKTCLYTYEYTSFIFWVKSLTIFILISIHFIYNYFLPLFFVFINNINNTYITNNFSIFFESKINELIYLFININRLILCLLIFIYLLLFVLIKQAVNLLLQYKKVIYATILLFSTLLSPPDVFSQLFLFITLLFILEIIIFIKFYIKLIR